MAAKNDYLLDLKTKLALGEITQAEFDLLKDEAPVETEEEAALPAPPPVFPPAEEPVEIPAGPEIPAVPLEETISNVADTAAETVFSEPVTPPPAELEPEPPTPEPGDDETEIEEEPEPPAEEVVEEETVREHGADYEEQIPLRTEVRRAPAYTDSYASPASAGTSSPHEPARSRRKRGKPLALIFTLIGGAAIVLFLLISNYLSEQAKKREAADRQTIQNVVLKWNAIKRESARTNDTSALDGVLTGDALTQKQTGLNYNRNANFYWEVESHALSITSIRFLDRDNAEALADIIESGREYFNGKKVDKDSYSRDHYEAIYLLERQGETWKIKMLRKNRSL